LLCTGKAAAALTGLEPHGDEAEQEDGEQHARIDDDAAHHRCRLDRLRI
jgi:hypothetical protein